MARLDAADSALKHDGNACLADRKTFFLFVHFLVLLSIVSHCSAPSDSLDLKFLWHTRHSVCEMIERLLALLQ